MELYLRIPSGTAVEAMMTPRRRIHLTSPRSSRKSIPRLPDGRAKTRHPLMGTRVLRTEDPPLGIDLLSHWMFSQVRTHQLHTHSLGAGGA
jgi:hypothetical protein